MSDFFVIFVLKTVIYIPPLFVSSQTKRAYYKLKKGLQIVCEDTNEGSDVFKTSHVYPVEFRFIGIFNRVSNSNIMNQTRLYGQTLFRHFLARLRRKTKCFTKATYMLIYYIKLLMFKWNNDLTILI